MSAIEWLQSSRWTWRDTVLAIVIALALIAAGPTLDAEPELAQIAADHAADVAKDETLPLSFPLDRHAAVYLEARAE